MPGRVIAMFAEKGAAVSRGSAAHVEAMKMEQALLAPFDGIVAEIGVAEGEQVSEGSLLMRIGKVD